MWKTLRVVEKTTSCRGVVDIRISRDIEEPIIVITGYYDTVRAGILDRCTVLIPNDESTLEHKMDTRTVFYHLKSGKKVVIDYGDEYEPTYAVIKEITEEDRKIIDELKWLEAVWLNAREYHDL